MSKPKPKQKFLPLREITLASRPLVKRAIAFSCDGDLAVTADDSVHVLIPEFPDLPGRREEKERKRTQRTLSTKSNAADDDGEESASSGAENEGEDGFESYRSNTRAQYSEGSKHMPVSYPPLNPRINRELFVVAGVPFPYDSASIDAVPGVSDDDGSGGDDDDSDDEDGELDSDVYDSEDDNGILVSNLKNNRPFGAGFGPITGVGSTMNHVVRVAWSPTGLGLNRRPILAILTSSGLVAMYGDGGAADCVLPGANEGMLERRELKSWMVLWGVGERLVVPGQQTDVAENIQGVAWAREIGPGQALLATINDDREVAIISIQTVLPSTAAKDGVTWVVHEVARFTATGPHPKGDTMDPDWTPYGTSFGVNWSPWYETGGTRTCLLSFVDRNYLGFRRISIKGEWTRGEIPDVDIANSDSYGRCIHLSTDAFVEFEEEIWTRGDATYCRGLIATPFHLVSFEYPLSPMASLELTSHTPEECGTAYLDESLFPPSENPIVDVVIHPPDKFNPGSMPLYTLVRLSATPSNSDWYETNVPPPADSETGTPQWVRDICQKLEISIPADMYLKRSYGGDSDSDEYDGSDEDGESDEDGGDAEGGGVGLGLNDEDFDENDDTVLPQGPEIHPNRFRLYGITISPGGGATAVLVSMHNTQQPERGGWHTMKTSVHFGYYHHSSSSRREEQQQQHPTHPLLEAQSTKLTTEARLFEYLYGEGPTVHGINTAVTTTPDDEQQPLTNPQQSQTARLRELFRPAIERQTCDLCGARMFPPDLSEGGNSRRPGLSRCEKGHFFGTCAASGLAVQMPGITRSCGTCGLRVMRAGILARKLPERQAEVLKEIGDGLCVQCGGKFLN